MARSRKTSQKTGSTKGAEETGDDPQTEDTSMKGSEEVLDGTAQTAEADDQSQSANQSNEKLPVVDENTGSEESADVAVEPDELTKTGDDVSLAQDAPAPGKAAPEGSDKVDDSYAARTAEIVAESDTEADRDEKKGHVEATPGPPARSSAGSVGLLIFGGIIAGLIGFVAARYIDDFLGRSAEGPTPADNATAISEQASQILDQSSQIAALQGQVGELAARDLAAEVEAAIAPLSGSIGDTTGRLDGLSTELAALHERVEMIALRPTATGMEPQEFDAALEVFRAELRAAIDSAQAEIDDARATAEQISDDAFKAEQKAVARAAWSQVQAALNAGTPYANPLEEVRNAVEVSIPKPLTDHANRGVVSLASLQGDFPSAARNALEASVRAAAGGGAKERLTAFLRVQTGARSLTPRDGVDPDAVLSRAEAALRAGDVGSALSELAALPEAGSTAMSDWASAAQTRVEVLAAAADLTQALE